MSRTNSAYHIKSLARAVVGGDDVVVAVVVLLTSVLAGVILNSESCIAAESRERKLVLLQSSEDK
jgi:hypothetical protein